MERDDGSIAAIDFGWNFDRSLLQRHAALIDGQSIECRAVEAGKTLEPAKRAFGVFLDCWDQGILLRTTGDTVALSPPLIIEREQLDRLVDTLRAAIRRAA